MSQSPLTFTPNARLDAALAKGWRTWEEVARAAGVPRVAEWAAHRVQGMVPHADLRDYIEALLIADDDEAATLARAELAELVEEADDPLAETLWEGVLEQGYETGDPDLIFEAASRLAAIAEEAGDSLAAAEYYIDFLEWRRRPGNVSEADPVQAAFEEIVRLAEADGQQRVAAIYAYRQVRHAKATEAELESATAGDWETESTPYESWS